MCASLLPNAGTWSAYATTCAWEPTTTLFPLWPALLVRNCFLRPEGHTEGETQPPNYPV